jgi:UDP:flavonoid glycosyltransferase YjiC (YdhE family)
VPVFVVPFGRDQLEVARRVEVSDSGTRLPAKNLTPQRLRYAITEAMTGLISLSEPRDISSN